MKSLLILPNFTILADCTEHYNKYLMGVLRCFCELEGSAEYVDTYRITPESMWEGLNLTSNSELDIMAILNEFSKEPMPENVAKDLSNMITKFGRVTLVGDDCLLINDENLLEEVLNNSSIKDFIYDRNGSLLFITGTSISRLQVIFQHEFNTPIKYHNPKIKTFVVEDGYKSYAVKAYSKSSLLRSLYGVFPFINESDLRNKLSHKKTDITEEDILKYIQILENNPEEILGSLRIKQIPIKSISKPILF